MSFRYRLSTGLRYIFSGKTVAQLRPSWESNQPTYAIGAKFETIVKDGYRKNELIFACIDKTADSAAQIALQVIRKRDEQVLPVHALLTLIHRPNDTMNESDFWSSVVVYQKLAGRAVYEIEYSNRGLPIALWPLVPDRLQVIASDKRPVIAEYIYKVPGLPDVHLNPEQVLDFPLFDPLDRHKSYPPVAVAARTGDVDNAATDHIKLIWEHGGMPAGLLKTVQVLRDTDVADIRRRWRERYGGHEKWLEPAVLDRDAEYQKTGMTFQELGFEVLDARDEARICMVLKVPPILVGAKIGLDRATYANYKEARSAWWEDTLLPMYENFMDVIEFRLLPKFDASGANKVAWDLSKVFAFQEAADAKWKRATEALRAGGITINEFCAEIGLETKGPAGEFYLQPLSVNVVPAKMPKPEKPIEQPEDEPGDDDAGAEDTEPVEEGEMEMGGKARKAATNAPDDDVRRRHERKVKKAMSEYFQAQLKRVKKDVQSNNGR